MELIIENEPPVELMAARPNDPDIDYDFELLYRLAKTPPAPLRVPIRATAAVSRQATAAETRLGDSNMESLTCLASSMVSTSRCGLLAYPPSGEAFSGAVGSKCGLLVYHPSDRA